MTDVEAIEFLTAKFDRQVRLAEALSVSPQTLHNWRVRGRISPEKRPAIWAMVNDNGGSLPRDWLMGRAA